MKIEFSEDLLNRVEKIAYDKDFLKLLCEKSQDYECMVIMQMILENVETFRKMLTMKQPTEEEKE